MPLVKPTLGYQFPSTLKAKPFGPCLIVEYITLVKTLNSLIYSH